jgi:hypothetical protein
MALRIPRLHFAPSLWWCTTVLGLVILISCCIRSHPRLVHETAATLNREVIACGCARSQPVALLRTHTRMLVAYALVTLAQFCRLLRLQRPSLQACRERARSCQSSKQNSTLNRHASHKTTQQDLPQVQHHHRRFITKYTDEMPTLTVLATHLCTQMIQERSRLLG